MESRTPCRDECNRLIDLAVRMEGGMSEVGKDMLAWRRQIDHLLHSNDLESLAGERTLDRLTMELRACWLRYANRTVCRYLKSPPYSQVIELPSGNRNAFPYDRWNRPAALEQRAARFHPTPPGWHADHVMFNSGMGAMTCLLLVMRSMYQPRVNTPLYMHGVGGYFEIMDLMSANHDELFRIDIMNDQQQLMQSVARGASQLIYIEPVATVWSLDVLSLEQFIAAWRRRPASPPTILVFDTTLTGNRFPITEVMTQLQPVKPAIVIQVSSTLKLDQEGLEFSNAGLMSIYSAVQSGVADSAHRMRSYRAALGVGMMLEQIAALDYPGFLDPAICESHCAAIFRNNARLARELEAGDGLLFAAKYHPALGEGSASSWAAAPFVNVRLTASSDAADRVLLKHVLHVEAMRRGLPFVQGASFGFRAHRCETGIRDTSGYQTIRISMGSREGPSVGGVIRLLNEMSRLGNFNAVRTRYPDVVAAVRNTADKEFIRPVDG